MIFRCQYSTGLSSTGNIVNNSICYICNSHFYSADKADLCDDCNCITAPVRDMLIIMKSMHRSFTFKEVFSYVLPKTKLWLDVCSLDNLFAALTNSGLLKLDQPGRYYVP